jgi:hypothetical protein
MLLPRLFLASVPIFNANTEVMQKFRNATDYAFPLASFTKSIAHGIVSSAKVNHHIYPRLATPALPQHDRSRTRGLVLVVHPLLKSFLLRHLSQVTCP